MHPELRWPWADTLLRRRAAVKAELLADGSSRLPLRVAILGGSTTNNIRDMLELFLLDMGIAPVFYESEFGQYWQDALFPPQALLDFAPQVVFIHTTLRNLADTPTMADSEAQAAERLEAEYGRFRQMWDAVLARWDCPVIQNNFEPPVYRLLGSRDVADSRGRSGFAARLNQKFYDYAAETPRFFIHDIAWLAADYGLAKWADIKYWHMFKYCPAPPAVPAFAASLSHVIGSLFGKNKKVLAVDLDNTLWGGVIGDDGQSGIEIGHETAMGEVYSEFQGYVKAHKALGVVLAVNSKNDEENALEGLAHPEGTLRGDDFAVIRANWENKDQNLTAIAGTLNLGVDSIVFADDNPAEREIVRQSLPGVAVPELSGVENYIAALDHGGWFEVTRFSADDAARAGMYAENTKREQAQTAFADYGAFLESLAMRAEIKPFSAVYLPRITQLTNKSNQFNLTTLRCTEGEMAAMAEDPDTLTLYGKLEDKFGDNGLVSVVAAKKAADGGFDITLWLMSCRVLKRGMEDAMMDALVAAARVAGASVLRGAYYKTAKNAMVRDFYAQFGFERTALAENGDSHWRLALSKYENRNNYIKVESE